MSKQGRKAHTKRYEQSSTRADTRPFCAYYGPNGETCPVTTGLAMVFSLPTYPSIGYMACPLHYDFVRQQVDEFLARCLMASQTITFEVRDRVYSLTVMRKEKHFQA